MKTNNLHTGETHYMCRDIVKERDTLAQRVKELEAALVPFANYACDDWSVCECHNCRGKRLTALAKHKDKTDV